MITMKIYFVFYPNYVKDLIPTAAKPITKRHDKICIIGKSLLQQMEITSYWLSDNKN